MELSALTTSAISDISTINPEDKTKQKAKHAEKAAGFSSDIWSPGQSTGFTMSAYTARGTLVELASRSQSTFSMGVNAPQNSLFKMPQQNKNELELSFTTAGGSKQTFKVTENSRFLENEDGTLSLDNGLAFLQNGDDKKRDANAIVVNLNGRTVTGGTGDDMIFNLANNATLDGGDGDDTLYTMGDQSALVGGNGNDLLKAVRNVMQKDDDKSSWKFDPTNDNLAKKGLLGYDEGLQVYMDAGEGDNTLEAEGKLRNSTIKAGDGNNAVKLDIAQDSKISMGNGQNSITVETLYGSSIKTGDGNNKINVGTAANSSRIETGAGDDSISVSRLLGESGILSGDGNDSISVNSMEDSFINAGGGNDEISVVEMNRSALNGGDGNDTIIVDKALNSIVDGGDGDDNIHVRSAESSMILGGDGNDEITVRGTRLIVDGGAGNNTTAASTFNSMLIDNGRLIANTISAEDAQEMKKNLNHTIETVPMDGESRQKYKALLHYATEQAAGSTEQVAK